MQIVPAFDVAEDGQARFGVRRKAVFREALDFERREETLRHGVAEWRLQRQNVAYPGS